ncbi:MAG: heavy metal sensor histidine kinase [Nitrospirae bacterium]|nr:heavy metal sensor histidine kinase [Nitrospirota bacterium]
MFLKTAEETKDRRPAWTRPGGWSITGRLTVLYTLSTVGMFLVATGLLYWVLVSDLEKADKQFLNDKIRVLRAILREHPDKAEGLEEEVSSAGAYDVRVLDQEKRVLIETPGMVYILPVPLFPAPIGPNEMPVAGVKWKSSRGRSYRVVSAWAEVGRSIQNQRLLQVALDITSEQTLIIGYRRRLMVALLGGILFSAGSGIAVARRGMRPVKEITQTAERITAAQLHERIDPARWPKELTALATAFDQMLDRLQESFTRLSRFSADLAHELRTPIHNLMGEAEVALSRNRAPEEYREVLESSLEEFAKLSRMIDGLLFLARAENPECTIERQTVEARKEIETVADFHDAVAKEQGIEIACEGAASLSADPILLRRALSNLLSNALQYTPRGGRIVVSARPVADLGVEIRVKDTGSGIAPEHLPKIFDRFYRADSARSPFPQGFGLGLAIVKSIMDLHGGAVAIQSEPSKGTTVTLTFSSPS